MMLVEDDFRKVERSSTVIQRTFCLPTILKLIISLRFTFRPHYTSSTHYTVYSVMCMVIFFAKFSPFLLV